MRIGGNRGPLIQDSHNIGGEIDLKEAVAQSSNVYFAEAIYQAYKNDPERYLKYLRHLGLDRTTGLDDMGEASPLLPEYGKKSKSWSAHTLPNLGYGYAIELPPIHTLVLYNAVANDGRMMAPRLIREVRRGGKTVDRFPSAGAGRPHLLAEHAPQGARMSGGGGADRHGEVLLRRHGPFSGGSQDRHGEVRAGRYPLLRRLLPRFDGDLSAG